MNNEHSDGSPDYTRSNHHKLIMGESNKIKASGHHE